MHAGFRKPDYDSHGFASLPARITRLLTDQQKYDAVVLLLIDGFGWRFFEQFQGESFLKKVTHSGRVEKLSSQFPSTTAAHLTTLHTGLPVGEHGVFEWIYYEPELDALIAPLLFSFAGTYQRDTLKPAGVKPRRLFPTSTLYHQLKRAGVSSTIFQHREYTPTTYGDVVFSGAKTRGYKTLPEALVNLMDELAHCQPPSYFVLYYDRIDSLSHEYGPASPQTSAEIQNFLMTVEHTLLGAKAGSNKKILFMLTADHGQAETDPKTTLYLNREARFSGLERFFRTTSQGEYLVPAGSARDLFLYIRPGMLAEAHEFLAKRLEGIAEVTLTSDLMEQGFFGPVLSQKFRRRVGDLVILPFLHESVWWYEKDFRAKVFWSSWRINPTGDGNTTSVMGIVK